MSYQLILTEKPKAAEKIADSLADGKIKKHLIGKVPYYELKHRKKKIVVCCAVGHLYGLKAVGKKGMNYPVFDIKWTETYNVKKNSEYVKQYLDVIKKLCKDAKEFVVACDYDIEGEVIGWNVLRFCCGKKDSHRMKFSTLTKDELIDSYEHKSKHLDWGQAFAGETRHILDWYWGMNLSIALTASIKRQKAFRLMSSGRVQGPALKVIVDKEKEIKKFKPEPYWEAEFKTPNFSALHSKGKFWKKPKFKLGCIGSKKSEIFGSTTQGVVGVVKDVKKTEKFQDAPFPFDLTSLQLEAYRCLGISPKNCLRIAQDLYVNGLISYPRTSSQKMPASINYEKILKNLVKNPAYKKLASEVLSFKNLKPNEGKKTDSAHPCIYVTGVKPEKSNKLYDLIAHRFLACFGSPVKRESVRVVLDVNGQDFIANGIRTTGKGWTNLYGKYLKLKEEELPALKIKDKVNGKVIIHSKKTEPPRRFTPASIIKKMELLGIGTKSTRSSIIDALYFRHYVDGKSIESTELGMRTVKVLEKYCPEILDSELTRHFEIEMEEVRAGKKKEKEVVEEARKILIKILNKFRKNELKIGKELLEASRETQKVMSIIGKCPNCKGNLVVKRSRFGLFAACSQYPKCKTTFSLPKKALIKTIGRVCKECEHPEVLVIRAGKRPFNYCLNLKCKLKESWGKKTESVKLKGAGEKKKKKISKNKK